MKIKALLLIIIFAILICYGTQTPIRDRPSMTEPAQFEETTQTSKQESSSAWMDLQSVDNARQLGGLVTQDSRAIKQNAILRTEELVGLTSADTETLINEYKLSHIIDLRDEVESEIAPDPDIEGVQYHSLIVWPRAVRERNVQESVTGQGFDSALYIKNYYASFALEPAAIDAYRKMFEVLLANESGGVLIHCVHGKDRTGIAVTLILSALGADWAVIEREYLTSNAANAGSVDISSLRHYINIINENYGSMENYLKTAMKLDENDITILRDKYTEPVQ